MEGHVKSGTQTSHIVTFSSMSLVTPPSCHLCPVNRNGALPLAPAGGARKPPTVAVIGTAGSAAVGAIFGGAGSGKVVPANPVGVYEAFRDRPHTRGGCTQPAPVYNDGLDTLWAVQAAARADVAVVVLAQTSTEGRDRTTLEFNQSDLAAAIIRAQPNTIVVTVSPGPFLTAKFNGAAAILDVGFAGEQEGNAVVVRAVSRSISPQRGSIRFRLAPRTHVRCTPMWALSTCGA